MSAHDPARRAEAAVNRWQTAVPDPEALTSAKSGRKAGGGRWVKVEGPHLRTIRTRDSRSRTGLAGVSYGRARKGPDRPYRTYFYAQLGHTSQKFCIETLGRHEAFRRAVAARAEHEIKVRAANAAILNARNQTTHHV